jgi:hypothetical protein
VNTPNGFVSAVLFDVHTKIAAETHSEKPAAQAEFAFKTSNDEYVSKEENAKSQKQV